MSKRIVKFALTTMGLAILVSCIVGEVDGVGRLPMILSGIIAVYAGLLIKR